ncbi:hypothetical protein K7432_007839 [Basidiobolus ranarum]|uniref:Uncharacterized protein n=1 Tax=Basidiobolus ranarum TaxID=34480 RepID=A0ABR2WSW8_9FUNG
MLSTQYPSNNQSIFTYSNENCPNFKRGFYEENYFGSCKKRRSGEYSDREKAILNSNSVKRSLEEEFVESDSYSRVSSSKRIRPNGYKNSVASHLVEDFQSMIEPRIVDITSGEVLQEVSFTSPPTSSVHSNVRTKALIRHNHPTFSNENLRILYNVPSNSEPCVQLQPPGLDHSTMQLVPYQPSYHSACQHSAEQSVHATVYEIQDDDDLLQSSMEIDQ